MTQQLWGGRYGENAGKINSALEKLNSSLNTDWRLYADDIEGSKAYAQALARAGYLSHEQCESILRGLELVRLEWIEGSINITDTDEDVHTVNERRLTELVGEVGQRLHTGRSRNDQVVTDMKLWMRKSIHDTCVKLCNVMDTAVASAEKHINVIMPGYTHMQRAQPVLFAHWLLSHVFALREDCVRFTELRDRSNVMPLGSGAIAGNPLNIDREWLAARLGFASVTQNSMHAVGDRDFVVDFIYCCTLVSLHLSRLAEDLILYSTKEFDFVRIADAFTTGSSLMPQKRNPDSLELIRGTSGSIFACLTGTMMAIKGTPSTYNKDLQFDKHHCFEAYDKLHLALDVTAGVISTMELNVHQMELALSPDMLATDWAYYLVRKGVPFRKAHHHIGQVVALAERKSVEFNEIPLGELQEICGEFDTDIIKVADYGDNLEHYNATGGTSRQSVTNQLELLKKFITENGKKKIQ